MRRKGRTILTLAGLAIGVALVIVISSLTRGLDHAQKTALDPLSSIGTDLTVTLAPAGRSDAARHGGVTNGGAFAGGGFGGGRRLRRRGLRRRRARADPGEQRRRSPTSRSSASPARISSRTSSCPARSSRSRRARRSRSPARRRLGRLDGPRPQRRPPGGDGAEDHRQAEGRRPAADGHGPRPLPVSAAEQAKIRACVQKLVRPRETGSTGGAGTTGGAAGGCGGGGAGSAARRRRGGSAAAAAGGRRLRRVRPRRVREVPAAAGPELPPHDHDAAADDPADRRPAADEHQELELHDRRRRPVRSRRSGSSRPRSSRAAASSPPARRTRRSSPNTYASRQGLKVGSTLDLNRTNFKVVGLVKPPLGGQTADVYVPLAAAPEAREPEGARERRARPRASRARRSAACRRRSRSSIRTRRSRARRTSPTRSAARS